MITPDVLARMKKRYVVTSFGVSAMGLSSFVTITQRTCQPQVVLNRGATGRHGGDVFHVHRHGRERLRGQAITATVAGLSCHLFTQGLGNVGSRHESRGLLLHGNAVSTPGQEEIRMGLTDRQATICIQKCLQAALFSDCQLAGPLLIQQFV